MGNLTCVGVTNMRDTIAALISSKRFEYSIAGLIIVNAVTLGMETSPSIMEAIGPALLSLDRAILGVFVVELLLRFYVHRLAFFKDPWRLFDLFVVGIALVPSNGAFSVLRALRILRVLRLVSVLPSLKKVVGGLVAAIPGMGSIMLLMMMVFYVFSVMATKLFASSFPEWFGTLGASAYSLFQIMTLESWSMGIVRPVMDVYPFAWMFFIPFILCTTFTVLNLFIGIIVSAMQEEHDEAAHADRAAIHDEQALLLKEVREIREEIKRMNINN
jgi:voltage-gated sodium channel